MYGPAVSMEEPKEKLRELSKYIPETQQYLLQPFGEYLAKNLNEFMVPEGFVRSCLRSIYELKEGVNTRTGDPVKNKLVGHPLLTYKILQMEIPFIARVVFNEEFADSVCTHYERIKRDSEYSIKE